MLQPLRLNPLNLQEIGGAQVPDRRLPRDRHPLAVDPRKRINPISTKFVRTGLPCQFGIHRNRLFLAIMLESDSQILVGTGNEGKIYRVDPMTGEHVEIGKCSADQVVAIHQKEVDGKTTTLLATGNPGKLFTLTTDYVKEGTLESEVHNAQSLSRWGKLSWEGEMMEGTAVVFSTRTGNTKKAG